MLKCGLSMLLLINIVISSCPELILGNVRYNLEESEVAVVSAENLRQTEATEAVDTDSIGDVVVMESEPNDLRGNQNHIFSKQTMLGELSRNDQDLFSFTCGETSEIELIMFSYDSDTGFELRESDKLIATSEFVGYQDGYAIQYWSGWLKNNHYLISVSNANNTEDIYALYYLREDHTHVWEVVFSEKKPTCVDTGCVTYICYCDATNNEYIEPTNDHTYSSYVSDNNGSPDREGTKTALCAVCGKEKTVIDEGVYLHDVIMQTPTPHLTGNIIQWEVHEGADLYQVYRLNGSSWELLVNTRGTAFKDETAPAGVKSYYKVRARNGNLMSSMAVPSVSAIRPILSNVTIARITPHLTGNIIYWEAVASAQFYQVYRLNGSSWELLTNTGGTAYKDETATVGVKSYYKIVARNGNYKSDITTTTSASAVRPAPVSELDVVTITEVIGHRTGNIIRWSMVDNAVLYQVYRLNGSSWELLTNTGGLAYKDETASVGVRTYYKIVARNGNTASDITKTKAVFCVREV